MGVIVAATDGSPAAQAALDAAVDLAREGGDCLAVITVWRALQGDFGLAYPSTALLEDLLEAERGHAESTLAEAAERVAAAGVPVTTHLTTGDPAERICALAQAVNARLIALGTHGHGSVLSLLMGNVSAAVLRKAHRPVLVVPDPAASDDTGRSRLALVRRAAC